MVCPAKCKKVMMKEDITFVFSIFNHVRMMTAMVMVMVMVMMN